MTNRESSDGDGSCECGGHAFVVAGAAVGRRVARSGRCEVALQGVEPVVPVVGGRGQELLGYLHGCVNGQF
jgi:hypothetical protein